MYRNKMRGKIERFYRCPYHGQQPCELVVEAREQKQTRHEEKADWKKEIEEELNGED